MMSSSGPQKMMQWAIFSPRALSLTIYDMMCSKQTIWQLWLNSKLCGVHIALYWWIVGLASAWRPHFHTCDHVAQRNVWQCTLKLKYAVVFTPAEFSLTAPYWPGPHLPVSLRPHLFSSDLRVKSQQGFVDDTNTDYNTDAIKPCFFQIMSLQTYLITHIIT